MEIILTFGIVAFFIALGLMFVFIFSVIIGASNKEDAYERLSRIYATRKLARRDEMMAITKEVRGIEKCPDGTFTDYQKYLWAKHQELERIDAQLTEQENNHLVDVRGYISDECADIIEGKR